MSLLLPDAMFYRITAISPDYLRTHGIHAMVLDIDNTLTGHDSQQLSAEVAGWLCARKAEGFLFTVASNNSEARVKPFAKKLGVGYVANAGKPFSRGFCQAQKQFGLPKQQIAVIGDQLFTDVLGGRLFGVQTLLVMPMYRDTKWYILLKRWLEAPLLRSYRRKGRPYYE